MTIGGAGSGGTDSGDAINGKIILAFNYFGDRARTKRILSVKPLVTGNPSFETDIEALLDFDLDTTDTTNIPTATGTVGNAIQHNSIYSVSGIGKAVALKINGNYENCPHIISAIEVIYEPGGLL